MDSKKYIGMDVHQASISVAVRDGAGKLVMECIIETKAATVLEFIRGTGNLWVALEEGTSAAGGDSAGRSTQRSAPALCSRRFKPPRMRPRRLIPASSRNVAIPPATQVCHQESIHNFADFQFEQKSI